MEGAVYDVQMVGRRPGTRYIVDLIVHGEKRRAMVYMVWNEAYGEPHLYCYYHASATCQCCEAVKDFRGEAHIDTDNRD